MNFYNPKVPNLQQMSLFVIAVKICNDLDVKALMKKYGHASFLIPSKEMRIFLNKKLPKYIPPRKSFGFLIKYKSLSKDSHSMYFPEIINSVPHHHFNAHRFTKNNLPCMMWEELISKKISSLPLPNSMKSKLMPLMRCICMEIDQWQKDHEDIFKTQCIDFQRYFCWNSQGKIDRLKTGKSLINDETLCVIDRYNLARLYFFVSDVISLWEKVPRSFKLQAKRYPNEKPWFQYMTKKAAENINQICRITWDNPLNLNARFSFLTQKEKKDCFIFHINCKIINYDDMCLCLSLLEKNEQEIVLRKCASEILQYYLAWPLQHEFLDVSKSLWPFISIEHCIDILYFIIYERIMIGWKDFDYVGLLKGFWMQTPNNFKELVKDYDIYPHLSKVISYEQDNSFPNEVILKNYKGSDLNFHHVGINYRISKLTSCCDISVEKFSGDAKENLTFWTQFCKIDDDSSIPPEDKFHYLLQAFVPKSKTARVVASFLASADNYPKSIAQLKDSFERDLLVHIYVRDLLSMVMKNAVSGLATTDLPSFTMSWSPKLEIWRFPEPTRGVLSAGRNSHRLGNIEEFKRDN
ncbi:uncharacterized protein TNIN_417571 [Trichonephila inaurata madagascariensis]|uniref:Uncharacterized protein n=1 Tax=Trichonephila inaurata madagascariensis TaxID=2747483 RepID=A0A8X6X5X5_9ARAC|nr:uncharacterized protein TNIN_417571 [Trichonephila inaurata madagascariensis]